MTNLKIRDDLYPISRQTGFILLTDKGAVIVGKDYLRGWIDTALAAIENPKNRKTSFITVGPIVEKTTEQVNVTDADID